MLERRLLSVTVLSLIALNSYIASIADAPRWLLVLFPAVAIVAQIIKDQVVENRIQNGTPGASDAGN